MNVELIEMIARGRLETKMKKNVDITFKNIPEKDKEKDPQLQSRKASVNKGNPDNSKDVLQPPYKNKDEILGSSVDNSEGERDEEAYFEKILNDNQFLIDVSATDNRLKRQGTMATLMSSEGREQGSAEQDISEKIKEQELARQDALYKLFNQVVLDKIVKEEETTGKTFQQIIGDPDKVVDIKLECIRGFKGLQFLRIPPKIINDTSALEEMFKTKVKKDLQDAKVKDLMGNLVQKGRAGVQISQSLISLSTQLQPGFSGTGTLPPSRLMDLNRRNKLLSTHENLYSQIQQSARYLFSSKAKLEQLTQAHKKLVEGYQIKKEQIVEKIRKINRCMKRLHEKNESKLLDKEDHTFSSPNSRKKENRSLKDVGFGDFLKLKESGQDNDSELNSPKRGNESQNMSLTQLKQTNSNSVTDSSKLSPVRKKTIVGATQFSILEEGSEDDEMFGEGAKQMVKKYLSAQSNGGNSSHINDVIYEILKGDLKRSKLMTEKQLSDLVDHQRENLSIKKDYLESLAKYVASLEDSLQKAQRKQRNMYLFLLEHPKDIT